MPDGELAYLTPEAKARIEIDRKLAEAGWAVQDARAVNLSASRASPSASSSCARRTAAPTTSSSSTAPRPE